MNTSKNIIARKNTPDVYKSQHNFSASNPTFQLLDIRLAKAGLSTKERIIVNNLFRKLHNEYIGKVVVRMLPYLPLKRGSTREAEKYVGYSHTQINTWINRFGGDVLREKLKGGKS